MLYIYKQSSKKNSEQVLKHIAKKNTEMNMAEINNNIHNYGFKIERIDSIAENTTKHPVETTKDETEEQKYIADPGILGRSQIQGIKGGNIAKSVNEAVDMAENEPIRLNSSEILFDNMYQNYREAGLSEDDAYLKALLAEDEFLDISSGCNR